MMGFDKTVTPIALRADASREITMDVVDVEVVVAEVVEAIVMTDTLVAPRSTYAVILRIHILLIFQPAVTM